MAQPCHSHGLEVEVEEEIEEEIEKDIYTSCILAKWKNRLSGCYRLTFPAKQKRAYKRLKWSGNTFALPDVVCAFLPLYAACKWRSR